MKRLIGVLKSSAMCVKRFFAVLLPHGFNKFIKKAPRTFAALVALMFLSFTVITSVCATNATLAFQVMVGQKLLGVVKERTVLAEAEILAAKSLNNSECNPYLAKPYLTQTVTGQSRLISAKALSDILIENSPEIVKTSVLTINGQTVAAETESKSISNALDKFVEEYKTNNGLDMAETGSGVLVNEIYTLRTTAESLPDAGTYLSQNSEEVPVQAFTMVTETESIAYQTEKSEDPNQLAGTETVVTKGKEGSKAVVYKVSYLNGEMSEKAKISETVLQQPVNEQIKTGTKRVISAAKSSASWMWPVQRVSGSYVSSYVGDGRGHKGMDIVAPAGSEIYAAEGGTVIFSGSDNSGYGNYIKIDHGNGLITLYAHCSELYVKKGDKVAAGEHIAAIGRTGYATGNHLHFEVRSNSNIVDPVVYIGSN